MRTLEFNTPRPAARDPQTLTVDLVGQQLKIDRPKDWVLSTLATLSAEDLVVDRDRAPIVLDALRSLLGDDDYETFVQRCIDRSDFLTTSALADFFQQTLQRWEAFTEWEKTRKTRMPESENPPITIAPGEDDIVGEPIRVRDTGFDIDLTFAAPKQIFFLVFAGLANTDSGSAYAVGLFLETSLTEDDNRHLLRRLKSKHDVFDAPHLGEIVYALFAEWGESLDTTPTPANREERRALARQ